MSISKRINTELAHLTSTKQTSTYKTFLLRAKRFYGEPTPEPKPQSILDKVANSLGKTL